MLIALLTTYLTRYIVVPAAQDRSRGAATGPGRPLRARHRGRRRRACRACAGVQPDGGEPRRSPNACKDEFFALVSHELRTPLTSIIGYLELVLDDDEQLSDDARRFLEVVDRNAKRLLRLVGDMLFVAQVEAGRLALEHGDVDLGAVAEQAVEAARPAAARADVELVTLDVRAGLLAARRPRPARRRCSTTSSPTRSSSRPRAAPSRCSCATTRTAHGSRSPTTGIGIPDDEQQHLFERFFRASTATKAAVPGAGLGLTIVKTIVEAHGGRLELVSGERQGTTVRVELPYGDAAGRG